MSTKPPEHARRIDAGRSAGGLLLGLLVAHQAIGCYATGDGPAPDDARLYFPTGVAVSPTGNTLFVANSDFDLRFAAGTVQAFDLGLVRAEVARCLTAKTTSCYGADASPFLRASVRIGAFASDLRVIPRLDAAGAQIDATGAKGRLVLPVRGDATLTLIDYEESAAGVLLRCSRDAAINSKGGTCAPEWRIGREPSNARAITLGGEPFGVALPSSFADPGFTEQGGIAAVVHQSSGDVSLFVGVSAEGSPPTAKLAYALTGLAPAGTGIGPLDILDRTDQPRTPRFLVTNRSKSFVQVVQYVRDPGVADRSSLTLVDNVLMPTQASGFDTRGVVVDPPNPGETRPTRVFLTSRSPASIVVGELDGTRLHFFENVPMPIGPSRITRMVVDEGRGPRTRIVASAFDARSFVVYDPDGRRTSSVVPTHRGPFAFAQDTKNKLAFVANFTDSTVQVIDLDPSHPTYQSVVYSIGIPNGPLG